MSTLYKSVNLILIFRFYSLWDTGYAKIHIPIIASVSEHQPTTWFSFFFDLHILACVFPVGLWYCIKNINDERVFIILYAVSAVYFAGVMVRLMLTLTPCVCVLAAIAFSKLFELYLVISVFMFLFIGPVIFGTIRLYPNTVLVIT